MPSSFVVPKVESDQQVPQIYNLFREAYGDDRLRDSVCFAHIAPLSCLHNVRI